MKNYTLNELDARTFILNYTVKGDKMIIHYASGDDYPIPYTIENKNRILEIMKEQVLNSSNFISEKKRKKDGFSGLVGLSLFPLLLDYPFMELAYMNADHKTFIGTSAFFSLVLINCARSYFVDYKNSKEYIEDVDKNKLFLDNEKLLNENILSFIGEKVKELNISIPEDKKGLKSNDMSRFENEELKTILDNIIIQKNRQEQNGSFILTSFWALVNRLFREYFYMKEFIEDIDNNKVLENDEVLNEEIPSSEDEKIEKLFESIPEDKPLLTLNDMDRFNYKELKAIIDDINVYKKRQEQSGTNTLITPIESPVLTRKIIKINK